MVSTSLPLVFTFALLLGAEIAPSIPIENTYLALKLDADKCLQLGFTPEDVGFAIKTFEKDKDSFKLSDLQGVSVTSRTTDKTHKVKEIGQIDVEFTVQAAWRRRGSHDRPASAIGWREVRSTRRRYHGGYRRSEAVH